MIFRNRNFYGSISVKKWSVTVGTTDGTTREEPANAFYHGPTLHGWQMRSAQDRHMPTCYYAENTGVGLVLSQHPRMQASGGNKPLRVGLIGLGTGTVAAYGRKGDVYRRYEIDPDVIRLASGSKRVFMMDADGKAGIEIVPGDARLNLEKELMLNRVVPFDVLVLDAFSGDAIPIHLLTREAFELYRKHLKPGGIIVVNISIIHFSLEPQLARQGLAMGFSAIKYFNDYEMFAHQSKWMILSEDINLLKHFSDIRQVAPISLKYKSVPVWTDDYSNLTQLLIIYTKQPFLKLYAREEE